MIATTQLLGLCLACIVQSPQEPEPPSAQQLIEAFRPLDADCKQRVLSAIERRLLRHPDPTIQRVVSMQQGLAAYPAATALQCFAAKTYVPAAADRVTLPGTDARTRKVAAAFPPPPYLDDLVAGVTFDWSTGKAVLAARQPDDDERFANLARGYLPGSDQAAAQILQALVGKPDEHPATGWFEHLYCDRDGHAFAGVRLYDAWYSGQLLEVPDVDVIAFARSVAHDNSFVSPIPADRRRDRLYQRISEAALVERRYRSLRQAAAVAFVAAAPQLDPVYQPLVERFQYLWPKHDYDAGALARLLAQHRDHDELLEDVDKELKADHDGWMLRETHKQQLRDVAVFLRAVCDHELRLAKQQ